MGLAEPTCCQRSQAWVSAPRVPSARTVTLALMSVGGVYPLPGWPSRLRPLGVVRTPRTRSSSTTRLSAGQRHAGALGEELHALRAHGRAQREVRVLQLREELAQGRRVDDRAREGMAA